MKDAYLLLGDGQIFKGKRIGSERDAVGELVFTTAMVGCNKTLSDPNYYGQLLLFTFPGYSYLATGEVIGKCLNLDKQPGMCAKEPMTADGIVRLSKIEVYPQHLDEYMKYATEVGEVSLRTEPGVLTMYAVSEKENPCKVTILETYASHEAYEKHIASKHFQKYKQGTLHMVKSLVLSDQTPLNPANRINNFIQ